MRRKSNKYGYELVMDLHDCDPSKFNRPSIDTFFTKLCKVIDMERCEVHFWDDEGVPEEDKQTLPHTKGTSAVCFILTSSIVIHTLDILKSAYINIFSCKPFDPATAEKFTKEWFSGKVIQSTHLDRI